MPSEQPSKAPGLTALTGTLIPDVFGLFVPLCFSAAFINVTEMLSLVTFKAGCSLKLGKIKNG